MPSFAPDDIVIVGIACRFAGAPDVSSYWRRILENRSAIGDHPNPASLRILDASSPCFDRLNTLRGGFLREQFSFQPARFGIAPDSLAGANPDPFLALQLASEALADAGLWPEPAVPPDRSGICVGYAAPVNPASANWIQHGLVIDQTVTLLQRLFPTAPETQLKEIRQSMKSGLPPVRSDSLRSSFGHALAGQCAGRLGLSGTACAVDAGAASAFAALRMAMDELRSGRSDLMLAGTVHTCGSLQVLMGLSCILEFTTRDLPHSLSRDADGTLPGEGGGFLVLRRRRDAEKARSRIYAVVKGIGTAAPDMTGRQSDSAQDRLAAAMRDAYAEGGAEPETLGLVEAHGSAVPREDQLEIHALRQVFADRVPPAPHVLVGSVKPLIGHCFASAGLAGLIKAALALHHRVLPPMVIGGPRMHGRLVSPPSPFYVSATPRPWVHARALPARRAGVTAFDGACAFSHVLIEEYQDPR